MTVSMSSVDHASESDTHQTAQKRWVMIDDNKKGLAAARASGKSEDDFIQEATEKYIKQVKKKHNTTKEKPED